MKISRDKLHLKLPIAIALKVLALAKLGIVQSAFAQGKLVIAIQRSVSSDEMLGRCLVVDSRGRSGHGRRQRVD